MSKASDEAKRKLAAFWSYFNYLIGTQVPRNTDNTNAYVAAIRKLRG